MKYKKKDDEPTCTYITADKRFVATLYNKQILFYRMDSNSEAKCIARIIVKKLNNAKLLSIATIFGKIRKYYLNKNKPLPAIIMSDSIYGETRTISFDQMEFGVRNHYSCLNKSVIPTLWDCFNEEEYYDRYIEI